MIVRPELRCGNQSGVNACSAPKSLLSSRGERAAIRKEAAAGRLDSSPKADLKFQLAKTKTGLWQVLDAKFACGGVFQDRVSATRFIRQELAGCRAPLVYVLIGSSE
ncbi:hypothetical protein [Leisingera sp. JC11]|uniref:hypothetical protein n=1 Tax=Leisingera sp. JC11 TaxID=3042469 RepID=UPI003452E9E6